ERWQPRHYGRDPAVPVIDACPVRPPGVIVLTAGHGARMRSAGAKVLHELGGVPLVRHVLAALRGLAPSRVVLVVGHQAEEVGAAATASGLPVESVLQAEQ